MNSNIYFIKYKSSNQSINYLIEHNLEDLQINFINNIIKFNNFNWIIYSI